MTQYKCYATMDGLPLSACVTADTPEQAADTFEYYLWCHGFKDDHGVQVEVHRE